ncbi:MAG: UDP-N-acetylmuramoyl-L-alanyl-D-glutamate--2,6-diaminopimelate ligase [Dethiobacter sp.]|jgi:UDP-N-acetylmuramoyl-L-alanyl-D-glutamate--2,6-diaminopimelate ligase|nr:UDP-N-acetylmuramoyl-L-alanyl-D-glutamate--2,6-diaminopimelate ligase [Dethiobacter sp.]
MKLKTIIKTYDYRGPRGGLDAEIRGIRHDSRQVRPGDIYVCLEGLRVDGHIFAPQAVARGAAAVVARRELELGVPVLVVDDTRHALSYLSDRYFAHPSRKLHVVGVTGTNGKTTTTHFLQAIYRAAGNNCAVIGTVGIKTGDRYRAAGMTTPEAFDLHRTFYELVRKQIKHTAMEVSSHSLSWQRVEHVLFKTAVFLNLSHDHLDFHRTMEEYFLAKAHLFNLLPAGGRAVINGDDLYGRRLIEMVDAPVVSFGMGEGVDIRGRMLARGVNRTDLEVRAGGEQFLLRVHLPGDFNAQNALAAAAVALAENIEPEVIARGIDEMRTVPGRLEAVNFEQEYNIFIDFAHTPDGLEKVLATLKEAPHRRLITVFGCPGDRDKAKRPIMGSIAEKYSDLVVVTSDNPASEDPIAIIRDILVGMSGRPVVLPDREEAVRYALNAAGKGDIVLLAGKGHENYQLMGSEQVPYSDRRAVETFFIS